MIKIEDLSFSYGNYEVLKGISFKMEEGKIYGLLGENGVGKTTLFRAITGEEDFEGNIVKSAQVAWYFKTFRPIQP